MKELLRQAWRWITLADVPTHALASASLLTSASKRGQCKFCEMPATCHVKISTSSRTVDDWTCFDHIDTAW